MLKLLLGHWQSHREPLPFVLTDDPLYCSHLTKSPFPEVYSVNRINPIFEEDEDTLPNSLPEDCLDNHPSNLPEAHLPQSHPKSLPENHLKSLPKNFPRDFRKNISENSSLDRPRSLQARSVHRNFTENFLKNIPENPSLDRSLQHEASGSDNEYDEITPNNKIVARHQRDHKPTPKSYEKLPLQRSVSDQDSDQKVIFQRSISDQTTTGSDTSSLKQSISEEARETETRVSDDTGYSSSDHLKSLTDDGGSRHMSSDSDDCSQPEALIVSVDVHRVSYPEDVIVVESSSSNSSSRSQTFSASSYYAGISSSNSSSQEPFTDSLTMAATEVKQTPPNSDTRDKLQRLLEKGNPINSEVFLDSLDNRIPNDREIEKTKEDLMRSLTRVLNSKVPTEPVTRTDSALGSQSKSLDRKSTSSSTSPKTFYTTENSTPNGITRQDESSASSSLTYSKPTRKHHHRTHKHSHAEKESKSSSSESKKAPKCKLCENANRPLAFHQLLPGHWSYDNVYLPQTGGCCSCVHHPPNPPFLTSLDDEVFYPFYYPKDISRARHSWAPYSNTHGFLENHSHSHRRSSDDKSTSTSIKEAGSSSRYSPDGSSRETDSSSGRLKKALSPERRSLREPRKCKCEFCLGSTLDKDRAFSHTCPCHGFPHRRVKFASDTDLSQRPHLPQPIPVRLPKDGAKLTNAALVMGLPHLNGHLSKDVGEKKSLVPRAMKEPIKMDDLYRTYPVNFRDWEAHYRRDYLKSRRRRALTMVAMAIGIIFVVGIAVALTFVFLRIKRPA